MSRIRKLRRANGIYLWIGILACLTVPLAAWRHKAHPNGVAVRSVAPVSVQPVLLKSWRLAFVRDGSIWVANGDGTDAHKIIANADAPCWSPDKQSIAFARHGDVWTARADGTEQVRVTHKWNWTPNQMAQARAYEGGRDIDLSWCSFNNVIDFSHWERFHLAREGDKSVTTIGACSLYEVPAKKPTPDDLAIWWDIFDGGADFFPSVNAHPAWSKDGNTLAFARNGDIWIAQRGMGGGPTSEEIPRSFDAWDWDVHRLAAVAEYDAPTHRGSRENHFVTHLSWSPDGQSLVYGMRRINGTGFAAIYLLYVNRDGSAAGDSTLLLPNQGIGIENMGVDPDPCFSPDGRFIAYVGVYDQEHPCCILALSMDGKQILPLIKDGSQPAW